MNFRTFTKNINSDTDMYFGNIMFKNEGDAKYVINNPNFRNILDTIFKSLTL